VKDDEKTRRKVLLGSLATGGVVAAGFTAKVFVEGMAPTQAVRNMHTRTADISKLKPGESLQIEFTGKPVIIYCRTKEQLRELGKVNEMLLDPLSEAKQQPEYTKNLFRSIKSEYFVAYPICTHLGCAAKQIPKGTNAPKDERHYYFETTDWGGGFVCPCHGAKFDMAGRVYKNMPAPTNLLIPEHRYTSDKEIEFVIHDKNI
jgi:ubiquinol-cytochrome c reductase iron-sulfur subunit